MAQRPGVPPALASCSADVRSGCAVALIALALLAILRRHASEGRSLPFLLILYPVAHPRRHAARAWAQYQAGLQPVPFAPVPIPVPVAWSLLFINSVMLLYGTPRDAVIFTRGL